jgi:hypothetical protein
MEGSRYVQGIERLEGIVCHRCSRLHRQPHQDDLNVDVVVQGGVQVHVHVDVKVDVLV